MALSFYPISTASWYMDLPTDLQKLIRQSYELFQREVRMSSHFFDYSFILFPIAKAYEGYLKKFLHDQQMITLATYQSKRFRIGRSLNPDIRGDQRDEWWLYDDLVALCGEELARDVWSGWIECRNHIFHYYVGSTNNFTLTQVQKKVELLTYIFAELHSCSLEKENI
jgi:hypothetical protein